MIFTSHKTRFFDYLSAAAAILFVAMLIILPRVSAKGALEGLKLSADILVPAVFPFAVPVIFLVGTGVFGNSRHKILILYVLSLLGGYPIGAKLISELKNSGDISGTNAEKLLPFCVNAGPSFIVSAIGTGILGDKNLGYILLISHILSSVILTFILNHKLLFSKTVGAKMRGMPAFDNFVYSVHAAANATIYICAFVVVFSVGGAFAEYFSTGSSLAFLINLFEVTTAVSRSRNIYYISFLLGFSGFCVWMQVLSQEKTGLFRFAVIRTAHGALSYIITALIIKISGTAVQTLGNAGDVCFTADSSGYALAFSMLVMILLLLVSISSKNHTGNLLKDVI